MAESLSSGFCLSRRITTTQPLLGAQPYNVHQYGNITQHHTTKLENFHYMLARSVEMGDEKSRSLSPPFSFLGRRVFDDHLTTPSTTLMRSRLHHNDTCAQHR